MKYLSFILIFITFTAVSWAVGSSIHAIFLPQSSVDTIIAKQPTVTVSEPDNFFDGIDSLLSN